jgi:hypothetical protein
MSANTVETILSRPISDAAFAEQLFTDPDQALAGYDLTAEENASLKHLSRADFDKARQSPPAKMALI